MLPRQFLLWNLAEQYFLILYSDKRLFFQLSSQSLEDILFRALYMNQICLLRLLCICCFFQIQQTSDYCIPDNTALQSVPDYMEKLLFEVVGFPQILFFLFPQDFPETPQLSGTGNPQMPASQLHGILPEESLRALSHYSGNTYLLYKYIHPVSPPLYRFFCSAHSALYMYGYHTFSDSILFHLQLFPFCIFPSKATKTEPHLYPWVSVLYTPCFL